MRKSSLYANKKPVSLLLIGILIFFVLGGEGTKLNLVNWVTNYTNREKLGLVQLSITILSNVNQSARTEVQTPLQR